MIDGGIREPIVEAKLITDPFVVLAETNLDHKRRLIGLAYYLSGMGLTGTVFCSGEPISLEDYSNQEEIDRKYPGLVASDRYSFLSSSENKPFNNGIYIFPLKSNINTIGVIKFHEYKTVRLPDNILSQLGAIVSEVITSLIQKNQLLQEQSETILDLCELGANDKLSEILCNVTSAITKNS